ncbi:MAG: DegV family protein [Bacilli bacterium]|nr:DegV family protein [Bacilli bacterium]
MNKVKIVVDSTVDLNKDMYEKLDIRVVPLQVRFENETFLDGVDIDQETLYARVEKEGKLPSTAAISPEELGKVIKEYIDQDMDIVFLGIGSTLSSTFQNFHIAAQEFPEDRVYAIDTLNLSSGSGLLVLKACKLRDEGKTAKEISELVTPLVPKVSAKFCLDRFDFMHKGGRCSAMVKMFGHLFHIHPVLKVVDGKLIVESKPRGPIKVAYKEMLEELKKDLEIGVDMDNIMITHAGMNKEDEKYLYDEVSKLVDPSLIRITHAGCIISSHCGYGTVGILYIKK